MLTPTVRYRFQLLPWLLTGASARTIVPIPGDIDLYPALFLVGLDLGFS